MSKNNTIITLIIIILILLVGAGFYYTKSAKAPDVNIQNGQEPAPVAPSVTGCYVANLGKDVYVLEIESEKGGALSGMVAFNNYDKDSSGGAFTGTFKDNILLGNYSFDSEGMHSDRQLIFKKVGNNFIEGFGGVSVIDGKETLKDPSAATFDPKFMFVRSENCTQRFTEADNTFTFDYNPFFQAYEGDKSLNTGWRLNATQKGVLLASVSVLRSYMPQTNFSDATFTVGRSSDPTAIKSCTTKIGKDGEGEMIGGRATIGGLPFTGFWMNDAGAGNFYDTTSYRGIVDGDCYAIEYTIHSTNIGNYSPDQGIKEFDKAKIEDEMEKIIKSFKFLIKSD